LFTGKVTFYDGTNVPGASAPALCAYYDWGADDPVFRDITLTKEQESSAVPMTIEKSHAPESLPWGNVSS